jgi:predicted amidophosphoribosyltransferase
MLDEISFPLDFTLTELVAAVFLLIIAGMLFNFGSRIELRLGYLIKNFPQGGSMVKQFVYLIVILIAYKALQPLALPYLADFYWLYHLIFLVIFLIVIVLLGSSIYSNSEELVLLFTNPRGKSHVTFASNVCLNCGEQNSAGTKFCFFCGEKLNQPIICSGCRAIIKPGAKFCSECGVDADKATPDVAVQKTSSCHSCGVALKMVAKFCPGCGAKVPEVESDKQHLKGATVNKFDSMMSPNCVSCHATIKTGAKFCPKCGAQQV